MSLLSHPDCRATGKPDAAAFRQGAGQGPRLPRRLARRLPRAALHRPIRRQRNDQRCEKRRLNPLGGEPRGRHGQASGLPTPPTGEQNQKKRTFEVLPKPDNFIRYRHWLRSHAPDPQRLSSPHHKLVEPRLRGPDDFRVHRLDQPVDALDPQPKTSPLAVRSAS